MATAGNAIAGAIGTAVGTATTPWALAATAISSIGSKLIDLIPDPNKKLEAAQHVADQQYQMAMAQIDQQNKEMAAASQNIASDPHMSAQRAYFCAGITTMLLFNYAGVPLIHAIFHLEIAPLAIPPSVLSIFAVIMLGFIGIPAALQMVQTVAGMPGDSTVKLPGITLGNKS